MHRSEVSDCGNYKAVESVLLLDWWLLSLIVTFAMTTPLSFSKFPFSGDVPFFEIGFMKSSLDRSASKLTLHDLLTILSYIAS